MPQVLENIIVGAVADPKFKTITLTWGERRDHCQVTLESG
jgi:hypothetical protein